MNLPKMEFGTLDMERTLASLSGEPGRTEVLAREMVEGREEERE